MSWASPWPAAVKQRRYNRRYRLKRKLWLMDINALRWLRDRGLADTGDDFRGISKLLGIRGPQ